MAIRVSTEHFDIIPMQGIYTFNDNENWQTTISGQWIQVREVVKRRYVMDKQTHYGTLYLTGVCNVEVLRA